MDLYLSYDGDHIGREVGRAILTDDVEQVRRTDQLITGGNDLWRKFAENVGGSVIEIGGDEGRICIGADHLDEAHKIAQQYAELVGATVSVGVGTKLSESARALLVAKLRGGNQIILWQDSMSQELEAVKDKGEGAKIAEEYLNKANTAANQGAHAGFEGHTQPVGGSIDKPAGGQKDHSEEQAIYDTVAQGQENQIPIEQTHAAQDFEETLHQAAQEQSKKDEQSSADAENDHEELRKQVVGILQQVKQSIPVLAQIKQNSPETYQAVMYLVQCVIALGHELMGDDTQPVQKTEAGEDHTGTKSAFEQQWEAELELAKADDLAKMALIWNDEEKPTTVWRLSNESGTGPYQLGLDATLPQKETAKRPLPFGGVRPDFDWRDSSNFESKTHFFGFEKPEHAKAWFGADTLEKLKQYGIKLRPFRANRVWRSQSGKQVFFEPADWSSNDPEIRGPWPYERVLRDQQAKAASSGQQTLPFVKAEQPAPDLGHVELVEHDTHFKTGQPVRVRYLRGTSPAPKHIKGTPDQYQQDIEPHGRYMIHNPNPGDLRRDWEAGEVQFKNPLVIAFNTQPDSTGFWGGYTDTSWKARLSNAFKARGAALSRKLAAAGHDGIVTVHLDKQGKPESTAEIVDLLPFHNAQVNKAEVSLTTPTPDRLSGGRADGRLPRDFDPMELSLGIDHETEHTKDPLLAREIAMDHLAENPKYYTQLAASGIEKKEMKETEDDEGQKDPSTKGTLDKSGGPIPGAPAHHHANLPVGSQVNGKVKVAHGDGKTGWKSVRSGMITSQDPDAPVFGANSHPVSSKEPGGK